MTNSHTMTAVNPSPPFFLVEGISKHFGSRKVLQSVSFSLAKGECALLEGNNGSGKSTLLKILAAALRPDNFQTITIRGETNYPSLNYRANIAFLSHTPMLYLDLSAEENLRFTASIHHQSCSPANLSKIFRRVNLEKRRSDLVRTFSRGMLQRLAICQLLVTDANIFLMDEPFSGLDRNSSGILIEIIRELQSLGKTLLITTHDPTALTGIVQRSFRLLHGKLEENNI